MEEEGDEGAQGEGLGLRQEKKKWNWEGADKIKTPLYYYCHCSPTSAQEEKGEIKKEKEGEDKIVPLSQSLLPRLVPLVRLLGNKGKIIAQEDENKGEGQQTAETAAKTPVTPKGIQGVTDWVDANKRSISWVLDATIVLGLAIALHSVRAFSRFLRASDVPQVLINRSATLAGQGRTVELVPTKEQGLDVVFQVKHRPLIPLWPSPRPSQHLLLKLDSLRVDPTLSSKASEYLQTRIRIDPRIRFSLLKRVAQESDEEALSCIIFWRKNVLVGENLGLTLVKEGLASPTPLDPTLVGNRAYEKYYAKLLSAENSAVKKELGMWKDTNPKLGLLQRLKQKLFR